MSLPPLFNSFNGGTDGVAISVANSGGASGDPFDSIVGSTAHYTNVQSHSGGMAMRAINPTVPEGVKWNGWDLTFTDVWHRVYLYTATVPVTGGWSFFSARGLGDSNCCSIRATTAGVIGGANAAGTTITALTGAVAFPLSAWFRVEIRVRASTTVGELEWRLFTDVDSQTIAETKTATSQVLTAKQDAARFIVSGPAAPFTGYIEDPAVSPYGWLGPAPVAPYANVTITI